MKKVSKALAMAFVAILLLSVVSPLLLVKASTGHPKLGAVDDYEIPTDIAVADFNVSIAAGSNQVSLVDGDDTYAGYYFAIIFYQTTWLVSFSGGQFDLYMSKDGYSRISTGDKLYASGFYVSDLDYSGVGGELKNVTKTNALLRGGRASFFIGKATIDSVVYKVLVGPIPFDITADYKFIKIFDGEVTAVAVSAQILEILPSLELTPTEGPGGCSVTLRGTALEANKLLNLTYADDPNERVFAQVRTDEYGKFTYTWNINDTKGAWTGTGPVPSETVTIYVWYNATGAPVGIDYYVEYTEYYRSFVQMYSVRYGGEALAFTDLYTGAGNDTLSVDVYVFDSLVVAGSWWNPTGSVNFSVDGTSIGSVTPNATGFFNITLIIPELSMGTHTVKVTNVGVTYVFTIFVHPTLILTPEEGPIGTVVTCSAYGFPEKIAVYIWWYEKAYGDGTWYNMVNGTTGADGKFNVTVRFTVFHTYGGVHDVVATSAFTAPTPDIAWAEFTVTPLLAIEPSVIKNDGSEVKAIGTGFDPRIYYVVNLDNSQFGAAVIYAWSGGVTASDIGDLNITFIAAGFRPGLHVMSLYPEASESPYEPAAHALFTVLSEGDPMAEVILSMNGTLIDLLTAMDAKIVNIQDGVALILTRFGTINTALSALEAKIAALDGNVATISTKIGTIQTSLDSIGTKVTSISGDVATIKTDLGTLSGKVTAIEGSIATIKTDLGTIKADISGLKTSVSDTKSAVDSTKSAVDGMGTAVWAAVILALIAAIAAIVGVFQISRKIAG